MKKTICAIAVMAVFGLVFFHCATLFAAPDTSAPIRVVVVSGSNYEMGVQYGEQAADLIAANRDVTWQILDNEVTVFKGGPLLGHDGVLKDIQVWTYYIEKYDPQMKEWLRGISKGCKNKGVHISYVDLIALMVLPQELWARPGAPYPSETGVASLQNEKATALAKARTGNRAQASCTSFAATGNATQDHQSMVSLTTGFIEDIKSFVILIAFPDEGERFIDLTMAGRIASNTGMNDKFAWIMTASVTDPRTPCATNWGVTSEVYFHYMLQYAKSPADAMKYLDATPKGGVTGIFLFADKSGDVFAYECSYCGCLKRKPGDLGENKDFVATTNDYNSPAMIPYRIPADWFPDTYVRYNTIFKELSNAPRGTIGLDFAKAAWLSNKWYDAAKKQWNTVVPNDFSQLDMTTDPPTSFVCYVPGNNCEGGEGQVIQFPVRNTTYLQSGGPAGTSIKYYWPDDPKPTGEYTKWQLKNSIDKVAGAASDDAWEMLQAAWSAFTRKASGLNAATRKELTDLLSEATEAWWKGRMAEAAAENTSHGRDKGQVSLWSTALTDYATAQLYSQMVTTKLK
ncbi:MAG TPA: C45 family autoproteolytic acyltransferase/hydrolase [Syntrophorhabdales bacterium]|nr:C45 family autoproteolytic acyltransferase/hydrolase [Syntrophorhabdales bacterium]